MEARTPAQKASFVSPQMVKERRRDDWLALFADDAVVQDPVGPSPFNPDGLGHRGKEAIGRFYDNIITAGGSFDFEIFQSYPCGDECANVWVGRSTRPDGTVSETPMVTIYKVNAEGKILSLRAFWDARRLFGTM
ncbi:MAG: nuclear transport factor 2 family protein [Proteobacteria bacterium]|nr:nuclear transport factor 2 family protein [Pseudomonadota bacterium]